MQGLLIEFNVETGNRAGNIDPRDTALQCHGWQKLDGTNSLEIRVIEDSRDISQYEGITGITILNDKTEINNAIDKMESQLSDTYVVKNDTLMQLGVQEKGIKINDYAGMTQKEILKDLHSKGVVGIEKKTKSLDRV